jgi:hypothetical protein
MERNYLDFSSARSMTTVKKDASFYWGGRTLAATAEG